MRNLFVLIALLAVTVAIPAFAQEQKVRGWTRQRKELPSRATTPLLILSNPKP